MRNYSIAGQVVALDPHSQAWRVYDPATGAFGITAATPTGVPNPDLPDPPFTGIRNYTDGNGRVVAYDRTSSQWRIYDPATGTLGASIAPPPAGTAFNPDLTVPALVLNTQPAPQPQPQRLPHTGNQPWYEDAGRAVTFAAGAAALVGVAVFLAIKLAGLTSPQDTAKTAPGQTITASTGTLKVTPKRACPTVDGVITVWSQEAGTCSVRRTDIDHLEKWSPSRDNDPKCEGKPDGHKFTEKVIDPVNRGVGIVTRVCGKRPS